MAVVVIVTLAVIVAFVALLFLYSSTKTTCEALLLGQLWLAAKDNAALLCEVVHQETGLLHAVKYRSGRLPTVGSTI